MNLFTFSRAPALPTAFIAYWAATYDYSNEHFYDDNIGGPHTPDTLRALFEWKIGPRFWQTHLPNVNQHFISRIDDASKICGDATPRQFLDVFHTGGAIYRIFWAHCWQPQRFPIYDQHVHRAMTFLLTGKCEELDDFSDRDKIDQYITRFIPFTAAFAGIDRRSIDQALWAFGKFIKSPPIPIE